MELSSSNSSSSGASGSNSRFFVWLLLGISIYLLFNSFRQQELNRKAEAEKRAATTLETKEKRLKAAKELAEKIASENPGFVMPPEPDRKRWTLGTMNAADGYQLLVTLDNLGAVIERIELVSQTKPGKFDYRSLQTKQISGYLGYLALDELPAQGLRVNSVPIGSPAATAVCVEDKTIVGMQPDDVIVGWEGFDGIAKLHELNKLFHQRKPGSKIEFKVERGAATKTLKTSDVTLDAKPVAASDGASASDTGVTSGESKPSETSDPNSNTAQTNSPETNATPTQETSPATSKSQLLTFVATLSEKPLEILRAEDDFEAEQVVGNTPVGSCALTLSLIDKLEIDQDDPFILGLEKTLSGRWAAKPIEMENGMGVEFTMPLQAQLKLAGIDANLELVKQYRLRPKTSEQSSDPADTRQYHVELTTIVRNLDDQPHTVGLRQNGLNAISLEGWWYPTKLSPYFFNAAGARDVISSDKFAPHSIETTRSIVANAQRFPSDPDLALYGPQDSAAKRNVNFIGLDTQVFTAAMQPSPSAPDSMNGLKRAKAKVLNTSIQNPSTFVSSKQQAYNIGFWFDLEERQVPAKGEWTQAYRIFAGPKDPQLLSAYRLDEAIEYGWDIFGFFAVRLGWILHFFFWITGNFGIAIMMLTVLVRSCMFPVSRKMALNAQKMQTIQPELAKLREALKDDPRKMMSAQQMLMKKAGINQLAGCAPAFIQLPIVIGLYRCVSVDVGLRQQPLIPGWEWCSNLAGPDMFMDWHQWMPEFIAGRGSGWFGPYLNILPIITITLFIIQQKVLMPKATDEQTRVAQQMMMVMTVFMGVLFFKVPAGLCIYFITSSSWSLIERFLIKKYTPQNMFKPLPDNTATEILQALNKGGSTNVRTTTPSYSGDKPKMKATKPPETLAELFEGWFGPKPETSSPDLGESRNAKSSGRDANRPPQRRPKKPKK